MEVLGNRKPWPTEAEAEAERTSSSLDVMNEVPDSPPKPCRTEVVDHDPGQFHEGRQV